MTRVIIIDEIKEEYEALKESFKNEDVLIVNEGIDNWLEHNFANAIVTESTKNGILVGDSSRLADNLFDGAISDKVKKCVDEFYMGELETGGSFITKVPFTDRYVINTTIDGNDLTSIYKATFNSLLCAYNTNMESVLLSPIGKDNKDVNHKFYLDTLYYAYEHARLTHERYKNDEKYKLKKLVQPTDSVVK